MEAVCVCVCVCECVAKKMMEQALGMRRWAGEGRGPGECEGKMEMD